MNVTDIQSSQHVFFAGSLWKVSLRRVHRFTQIADTKRVSRKWQERIKKRDSQNK